jgi:L-asparagine transporter-like permease
MMKWPFSGAVNASFQNLNRALFSVGSIFALSGFAIAVMIILWLNPIPEPFSWPLTISYVPILIGLCMICIGGVRWHSHESKEHELKDFIMDSLQKEQTGTVEVDGETVFIEAEIGMEENDS